MCLDGPPKAHRGALAVALERGGEEGGVAFFGNHSKNGRLYDIYDEDMNVVVDVTMELLIEDFKENT